MNAMENVQQQLALKQLLDRLERAPESPENEAGMARITDDLADLARDLCALIDAGQERPVPYRLPAGYDGPGIRVSLREVRRLVHCQALSEPWFVDHEGRVHVDETGMDVVVIFPRTDCEYEATGGGPDEEGFGYWHERVYHDGGSLVSEFSTHARDCDGPLETSKELHWVNGQWETMSASQRDAYAEAMGY